MSRIWSHCGEVSKKGEITKDSYNIIRYDKKYNKEVKILNQNITALINTGSDLSLMREEQYIKLGSPKLTKKKLASAELVHITQR